MFVALLGAVVALPEGRAGIAYTFGTGGDAFTIDFVHVANANNAADNTGYGAVPYDFLMGTYEISGNLIAKATAGGLTGVSASSGATDKPATGVSWIEAAKFVNWLNSSLGYQPAYNFSGGTFQLWSSAEAWQNGGENLYRHRAAHFFLPSEDEWYKAAYYDGNLGVYYDYPTGSNSAPTPVGRSTAPNTAVYKQSTAYTPAEYYRAGGLSPYGTMGQGGNVYERLESALDGLNDSPTELRTTRSGVWWAANDAQLLPSYRTGNDTTGEYFATSFRVAAVPEPVASAAALGVFALGYVLWRRRPVN